MPKQSELRVAYFCVQMLSDSREVIVHAPLDGADDDGNCNTDDEDNTVTQGMGVQSICNAPQ